MASSDTQAQHAAEILEEVAKQGEHHTMLLVLGITGLLALAVLVVPLAARLKLPFTVMLAAVGILIGLGSEIILHVEWLGFLHEFIEALHSMEITSDAVFFIFLPALVFESALAIDVRRLLDDIAPILMLAVLGLLISTAVVGFTMASVTGYALLVCLLLGAIVSATDPVAVVAIFKDLGAPKRLAILVEGESLFNDATAIVAFTILSAMIVGESDPTLLSGTGAFIKVFFGGIFVGYIVARITCFLLKHIGDSNLPKITLTMSLAYLAFIIAEHNLHVSGVMAVVTAALVLGSRGRSVIPQSAWHGLEEVWEQIGFIANSVIFVLVGLAVPTILAGMGSEQFIWLAVLLVAAFAARLVIIFGLVPAMQKMGWASDVSTGYRAVMFWGGLRGAVSLALALAVMENNAFSPEVQQFVGVLVTGFVLFTLAINATTVHLVMSAFGLDKLGAADMAIRNRVFAGAMNSVGDRVRATANALHADDELTESVAGPYAELARSGAGDGATAGIDQDNWLLIGLRMVSMSENKAYHKMFDQGEIDPDIARILFSHGADVRDSLKSGGVDAYVANYRDKLAFDWQTRLGARAQRSLGRSQLLTRRLAARFSILGAGCTVLETLGTKGVNQVRELIGEQASERLVAILKQRLEETHRALESLRAAYPDYAAELERRFLQQTAMRLEQGHYKEMLANSIIGKEVYTNLTDEMSARYVGLQESLSLDLGLDAEKLVAKVPFFQGLDSGVQQNIAAMLKPRLVLPGEAVFEKDGPPDAMYFISSGAVRVPLRDGDAILGSGDFFGELALLWDNPRMASVYAEGFCELLTLYTRDFERLLNENAQIKAVIEEVARERREIAAREFPDTSMD